MALPDGLAGPDEVVFDGLFCRLLTRADCLRLTGQELSELRLRALPAPDVAVGQRDGARVFALVDPEGGGGLYRVEIDGELACEEPVAGAVNARQIMRGALRAARDLAARSH